MTGSNHLPPLSLYIHLPWCIRKCPYCDFNSHAVDETRFPEAEYIAALVRDLEFELPGIRDREITSIFIGGGTPSLFSAGSLDELLTAIRSRLALKPGIEITLEANPGTVESARFQAYREAGINRLSIGVQSFNDQLLESLQRIHDGDNAAGAIEIARSAGFERINIDLMYGLPGQSLEEAMTDIERGLAHHPTHLSWYQLTIEPNTLFYKHRPRLPPEDDIWTIHERGQELLASAGYRRYEISAYAAAGHACRHNLNYWEFGDYLGLGAGAHGKLTGVGEAVYRFTRHRLPESYLRLAGRDKVIAGTRELSRGDLILEFMMNALRLTGGFEKTLFTRRTGLPMDVIEARVHEAAGKGWLEWDDNFIKPTPAGLNYLNDLLQLFMPGEEDTPDQSRLAVGGRGDAG